MNTAKIKDVPFKMEDVISERGKPMSKRRGIADIPDAVQEEWVYYNKDSNTKEYYLFKDGQLLEHHKTDALF